MLQLMTHRELGVSSPRQLVRCETARRVLSLQLSKYQDVEPVHSATVNCLDLDPVEQRYLLSGAANGVVAIHDLHVIPPTADAVLCTYPVVSHVAIDSEFRHRGSVETVQWYPCDTGMFLSSGTDKLVKVWDTNLLRTVNDFKMSSFVFCHDMSSVATQHCLVAVACGESRVHLLDLKSSSSSHMLRGHQKSVLCVRWSPRDQFVLATSGEDGRLMLWDVRSAKGCLKTFDQHNGDTSAGPKSVNTAHSGRVIGVRFLPDGLRLLSLGTDHRLRLWDVMSGRNTLVNYGRVEVVSRMTVRLAVSPVDSGMSVAYVPAASDIVAFDVEDGQRLGELRGHYGRVNCLALSSASHSLYSGANDRAILVWTPDAGDPARSPPRGTGDGKALPVSGSRLGGFARRVGGGTVDSWSSDEES